MSNTELWDKLKREFSYDPETGVLSRGKCRGAPAGPVGSPRSGYLSVMIGRKNYQVHRLAWLYMTGAWPTQLIDHIDGDKQNNRWSNLRAASHAENSRNSRKMARSKSPYKGVTFDKRRGKWQAQLWDGQRHFLGYYSTPDEAAAAYREGAEKYHGEFARTE